MRSLYRGIMYVMINCSQIAYLQLPIHLILSVCTRNYLILDTTVSTFYIQYYQSRQEIIIMEEYRAIIIQVVSRHKNIPEIQVIPCFFLLSLTAWLAQRDGCVTRVVFNNFPLQINGSRGAELWKDYLKCVSIQKF